MPNLGQRLSEVQRQIMVAGRFVESDLERKHRRARQISSESRFRKKFMCGNASRIAIKDLFRDMDCLDRVMAQRDLRSCEEGRMSSRAEHLFEKATTAPTGLLVLRSPERLATIIKAGLQTQSLVKHLDRVVIILPLQRRRAALVKLAGATGNG